MNQFWPRRIATPDLPLGVSLEHGLKLLELTGGSPFEEVDGDERSFRVNLPDAEFAIYDRDGVIHAVWYNDPTGRLTGIGRRRKLGLYMARYTKNGSWEKRIDNGWMRFYFNDIDGVCMVYGTHNDVIRINRLGSNGPTSGGLDCRSSR